MAPLGSYMESASRNVIRPSLFCCSKQTIKELFYDCLLSFVTFKGGSLKVMFELSIMIKIIIMHVFNII